MAKSPFSGFKRIIETARLNAMATRVFSTSPPPADVRIPYGPDPLNFGDLRLPRSDGPHPVLIVIHGGFWRAKYTLDHIGHLSADMTAHGIATWSVEYRRIGDEGGGWPNTMLDVGAATDHLRELAVEYNLDLDRVAVLGHSAGGHLAAWVASRHRIPEDSELYMPSPLPLVATIPLAGVLDLRTALEMGLSDHVVRDLMGGDPGETPQHYADASPVELLPIGVPQVLIHGTEDPDVPQELSKIYADHARETGDQPKLVPLRGAGHFEVIDTQSKWYKVVRNEVLSILLKRDKG
ncbi:MAG: alpha/beta hydrolase [Chloroflexota bacterium]